MEGRNAHILISPTKAAAAKPGEKPAPAPTAPPRPQYIAAVFAGGGFAGAPFGAGPGECSNGCLNSPGVFMRRIAVSSALLAVFRWPCLSMCGRPGSAQQSKPKTA